MLAHSRKELEVILQVLEKRDKAKNDLTRKSPEYTSQLEQYNISKLKKMAKMKKKGIV